MSDKNQGSGFGWFLLGLGIGAAVGVLYAPKPGNETRDDLIQGAKEGGEYLKQKSRVAADQINNLVEVGKDHASDYIDRGKDVVDRGRSQWETIIDRGRQCDLRAKRQGLGCRGRRQTGLSVDDRRGRSSLRVCSPR